MIKHLQQTGSRNCGQTCVAMLLGRSCENVSKFIKSGATHYQDLGNALNRLKVGAHLGHTVYRVTNRAGLAWGRTMLCRVRISRPGARYVSHWIVIEGTSVYDPALDRVWKWDAYKVMLTSSDRAVTSYAIVQGVS